MHFQTKKDKKILTTMFSEILIIYFQVITLRKLLVIAKPENHAYYH